MMIVEGELPVGLLYSVTYQGVGKPARIEIVWEVIAQSYINGRVFSQLRMVTCSLPTLPGGVGPTEFKEKQHV